MKYLQDAIVNGRKMRVIQRVLKTIWERLDSDYVVQQLFTKTMARAPMIEREKYMQILERLDSDNTQVVGGMFGGFLNLQEKSTF